MIKAARSRRWEWAPLALVLLLAACSSSGSSASVPTTALPPTASTGAPNVGIALSPTLVANLKEVTSLTALGDSVPAGTACNCTPYPQLTAADIAHVAGHPVSTLDDAVPGDQSGDVLTQLEQDADVVSHVEYSQAVTVEVGANDVAYSSACGTNASCYEQKIPQVRSNLDAIVEHIRQLTDGRSVTVVLLDYWSVWLGGTYAEEQGPAYVSAAEQVTSRVSDAIRSVATATHSYFVDLQTAFHGRNREYDETHLLAPDGDHPNAAGHVRIEQAIAATLALHA
jgi:lysophospholipase L1-like esterase